MLGHGPPLYSSHGQWPVSAGLVWRLVEVFLGSLLCSCVAGWLPLGYGELYCRFLLEYDF
jgi:hypothetical protein